MTTASPAAAVQSTSGGVSLSDFSSLRILVVDDDPMAQEIMDCHYRDMGFTVDVAENGRTALALLEDKQLQPDIILCDRCMPDVSGVELLGRIRGGRAEWDKIVFVFVTALKDRRDRHAMADLHPDGYLTKPINFTVADQTLAILLAQRLKSTSTSQ